MDTESTVYHSPTFGDLTLSEVRLRILAFLAEKPSSSFRVVIGTDSQSKNGSGVDLGTEIVVHRVGYGGIYFWKRRIEPGKMVLRTRMYQEALLSLSCAQEVIEICKEDGIMNYPLEIHVDIGPKGETREMVSEIVGMIRGSGFDVKTKPYSYAASKVADRYA